MLYGWRISSIVFFNKENDNVHNLSILPSTVSEVEQQSSSRCINLEGHKFLEYSRFNILHHERY